MTRAAIIRALRGTRWIVDRFERLKTKTAVTIHHEESGLSVAFAMKHGGNAGDLLREIRKTAKTPIDELEIAMEEQRVKLAGQA